MGIFIYAFTATGKTELNKKYKNVIDMESTKYKYIGKVDETSKSTPREINKEWPNNYFKALDDWWIYPNIDLKEEYLKRCRDRGNNKDFIDWYSKLWDKWIKECINDKNATRHIELKSGQYLEDVLPNLIEKERR